MKKVNDYTWEIPKGTVADMKVPGIVFADDHLLQKMQQDRTLIQCANVATLPGIHKYSITLPDGHEGYGFPIGGVAAFSIEDGVLSPGGVGYDINCGVRILQTNLTENEIRPKLRELIDTLFHYVPSGLGSRGKIRLTVAELEEAVKLGAKWAVEHGYGWEEDLEHCEENGAMKNADAKKVSDRAKARGLPQLGSLGSGNHFLEIQRVDKIFDPSIAKELGIYEAGQITVMIHTGSRGYGHQVCSDYLRVMERAVRKYGIRVPDRELACAPGKSPECIDYFDAMATAANFAWCNRQLITHWAREAFEHILGKSAEELGMHLIYDVAHNIAKLEEHTINGKQIKVWVHRKGATRAFPPYHPEIPQAHQRIGQVVIIPGSMEDCSYILVGTKKAMEISFGSAAHGSGRLLSRAVAKRQIRGSEVKRRMENRGVLVKCASFAVLAEEAGPAYKPCDRIALVSDKVGIAKRVVRLLPIAVTKG